MSVGCTKWVFTKALSQITVLKRHHMGILWLSVQQDRQRCLINYDMEDKQRHRTRPPSFIDIHISRLFLIITNSYHTAVINALGNFVYLLLNWADSLLARSLKHIASFLWHSTIYIQSYILWCMTNVRTLHIMS